MAFSYYIKNRVKDIHNYPSINQDKKHQIKELLDNIYTCCINGNIGRDDYAYRKIHRKNLSYTIPTDIKFKDIYGKYSDNPQINNDVIRDKIIQNKDIEKTKILSPKFLYDSYLEEENTTLFAFDDNDNIYSILTFFYNIYKDCIEIQAFWSNTGGGIIMNYLINAIKCGISLCSNPSEYNRELILYSVDEEGTKKFYKKFKFIEENEQLQVFSRELSVNSVDDLSDEIENLKDLDEEKKNLVNELDKNNNSINKLKNKLENLNIDLQYLSNITTTTKIDTTKKEINNLQEQQINIIDNLIQTLNKIVDIKNIEIEMKSKLYLLLDNKDILDEITFIKNNEKKLQYEELIEKIKKMKEKIEFIKYVKRYFNNNKTYIGMDIERALTGVFYDIEDEKQEIKDELKLIKKLKKMKEEFKSTLKGGGKYKPLIKTKRKKRNLKRKNKSKKNIKSTTTG